MTIVTTEIAGFSSVVRALRLPFKKSHLTDSAVEHLLAHPNDASKYLGVKDLALLRRLIASGDEHAKVVRGIQVWALFTAPRYWWVEMDTYRIGVESLGSESTMHCEAKGLTGKQLQDVKSELKEGHSQTRELMLSYQALRRVVHQRWDHRLPEWHATFVDWVRTLPLAQELIFCPSNQEERIKALENENAELRKQIAQSERTFE